MSALAVGHFDKRNECVTIYRYVKHPDNDRTFLCFEFDVFKSEIKQLISDLMKRRDELDLLE